MKKNSLLGKTVLSLAFLSIVLTGCPGAAGPGEPSGSGSGSGNGNGTQINLDSTTIEGLQKKLKKSSTL